MSIVCLNHNNYVIFEPKRNSMTGDSLTSKYSTIFVNCSVNCPVDYFQIL